MLFSRKTSKLTFPESFTMEAWVKPNQVGTGRIWDKITPGGGDGGGLLLDLHGGLRFICGKTHVMANRSPPAGQWTHIACAVNLLDGRVRIYLDGEPAGGGGSRRSTNFPGKSSALGSLGKCGQYTNQPRRMCHQTVVTI